MLPSNGDFNGYYEPSYFTNDPSVFNKHFFNDFIPDSKLEEASLSFLHLPLYDHDDFLHDLEIVANMGDSAKNELNRSPNVTTEPAPTKKTPAASRKDRHSKITTARGVRDRRMRLSVEVARRFFKLQDMLGFDKPSKTVEWLLTQAKHEIDKLEGRVPQIVNYGCTACAKSASSTSECEAASGIRQAAAATASAGSKPSIKVNKIRKSRTLGPLTKDMRNKARARARERTSFKKMFGRNSAKHNCPDQLCSRSSFENGEDSSSPSPYGNFLEVLAEVEEHLVNHYDDSSAVMAKWSPSSFFNYPHNIGTPEGVSLLNRKFPDYAKIFSNLSC